MYLTNTLSPLSDVEPHRPARCLLAIKYALSLLRFKHSAGREVTAVYPSRELVDDVLPVSEYSKKDCMQG
jgi:hypothetical protein